MGNFSNRLYVVAITILFSCGELICSTQKIATQIMQKSAPVPTVKKEIFIAGPSQERLKSVSSDDVERYNKHYAIYQVENDLLEAYAKTKTLPTFAEHQKAFDSRVKQCEEQIVGRIAALVAGEKRDKVSPADVRVYYEKIRANPNAYKLVWNWTEQIPAYSDVLVEDIKGVLYLTWLEEARQELKKEPLAQLKTHRFYKQVMAECKEPGAGSYLSPYVAAAKDVLIEEAAQKVRAMSKEQRQKYLEKFKEAFGDTSPFATDDYKIKSTVQDEFINDILQKIATDYTIKSDSQYILEAVKKAQNRTLRSSGPIA